MKMKKTLALILSLATVCSVAFTSMAEEVVVEAVEAVATGVPEVEEVIEVKESSVEPSVIHATEVLGFITPLAD